eukprot:6349314-Pyramimonas_sp.AAC.1
MSANLNRNVRKNCSEPATGPRASPCTRTVAHGTNVPCSVEHADTRRAAPRDAPVAKSRRAEVRTSAPAKKTPRNNLRGENAAPVSPCLRVQL